MNLTSRTQHCNLHRKLPFWNLKRAKNWYSELCTSTFPTFFGLVLGSYCMMWLWLDHLKTYFTELIQLKYKLILSIKTMGCCGLACVVWLKSCELSKRKSVLIVGNSSMMGLLQKFLNLIYLWTFFIFYQTEWTCWVFLLPVRSYEHLKGIQAFEAAIWCLGNK